MSNGWFHKLKQPKAKFVSYISSNRDGSLSDMVYDIKNTYGESFSTRSMGARTAWSIVYLGELFSLWSLYTYPC